MYWVSWDVTQEVLLSDLSICSKVGETISVLRSGVMQPDGARGWVQLLEAALLVLNEKPFHWSVLLFRTQD